MEPDINEFPVLTMAALNNRIANHPFLSDVQFLVGEKRIYAHSFVLMLRSNVFLNQMMGTMNEQKLIPIEDVEYDSCYQFVQFIYTDECVVTTENLIGLYTLAKRYKILGLENLIMNDIYVGKGNNLFGGGNIYLPLFEQCLLENNQIVILHRLTSRDLLAPYLLSERFLSLSFDLVEMILKVELTNIPEFELWEALMRWIEKNAEDNQIVTSLQHEHYKKLLHLIRFPVMTIEQISACKNKYPHMFTDNECLLLFKALTRSADMEYDGPWNIKQRRYFNLDLSMNAKATRNSDYYGKFETRFCVSCEMILIGLWYGNVIYRNEYNQHNKNLLPTITCYHYTENNEKKILFSITGVKCYLSNVILNLGESLRLLPNIKYSYAISYPPSDQSFIIYRKPQGNLFINVSQDLIKVEVDGNSLYGMFFKLPED